jgi:hypothetical protein
VLESTVRLRGIPVETRFSTRVAKEEGVRALSSVVKLVRVVELEVELGSAKLRGRSGSS